MTKICPRCHHKNPDEALWCKDCNYRLVQHIGLNETIKKPEQSDPTVIKGNMPFFIREQKKGRKKIGLIIVTVALILIIPTFYLLYTEVNRPPEEVEYDKFIGKWISTEDNTTTLNFHKNGTCFFKNTNKTFDIRKGSIRNNEPPEMILEIKDNNTKQTHVYTYEFNEEKTRLTLAKVIDMDETEPKEKYRKIK